MAPFGPHHGLYLSPICPATLFCVLYMSSICALKVLLQSASRPGAYEETLFKVEVPLTRGGLPDIVVRIDP